MALILSLSTKAARAELKALEQQLEKIKQRLEATERHARSAFMGLKNE